MHREITIHDGYDALDDLFASFHRIFLVCGGSYRYLEIGRYLDALQNKGIEMIRFSDYAPNPTYSSVQKAVKMFQKSHCDCIVAVGGGSAMDVAKCVKLYAGITDTEDYLHKMIVQNDIPFIAVPTTAGSGSEATRFAVIYQNGNKLSIADESGVPSVVIFDPSVLRSLPDYQKKATMMDAFCHSIESFWSVNATEESKALSKQAIALITDAMPAYLRGEDAGCVQMLKAANIAGKAINITQTTAGHAMCYKLTGLYGIAHGHAAALCVGALLSYMPAHTGDCIDPRGETYLQQTLDELAAAMQCDSPAALSEPFHRLLHQLGLEAPAFQEEDFAVLKNAVNSTRLKNHPIKLSPDTIEMLYRRMAENR